MKTPFSLVLILLFSIPTITYGQSPPDLGDAASFAVFTSVGAFSNSGNTVVTGDIGTNVGAFSGFPPGIVIGQIHVADLVSSQAAPDVDVAYSYLAGLTCGAVLGTTLGNGQVLTPNIYCLGAASVINGTLTLDAQGNSGAIFIFQIDGALSTGVLANVVLINSASLCNVYWQVNGAFTLGDGSVFRGTLINNGAIHLLEASSLFGRALSRAGAIDLHNNVVSIGLPPVASVITANGPTTFCAGGSVTLSGNVNGMWSNMSSASSIVVTTSGDYFVVNTGACGSATSNHILVTVLPNIPPSIICPASITIQCNQSTLPAATGTATASDNCGPSPSVTFADVTIAGACPQAYIINRTWTATDAPGLTANCTQTISVIDQTPPAIILPPGLINGGTLEVQCFGQDPNWDLPVFNAGSVTSNDNCTGVVNVTFAQILVDEGVCAEDGYINLFRLTWTATDACGNSSSAFIFMSLIDTIPPVIHGVPADITINCDLIPPTPIGVYATDECLCACVLLVSEYIPTSGCLDGQVMTRTWTAKDRCGNMTTATQRITFENNTPPEIHLIISSLAGLSADTTMNFTCSEGGIPHFLSNMNAGSVIGSSTCGGNVAITFDQSSITANNCEVSGFAEQQRFHWNGVDQCGNEVNMTITAQLTDNEAPVFVGVPSLACMNDPSLKEIEASDNCSEAHVRFWDTPTNNPCGTGMAVQRTYEAYDDCGNFIRDTSILIPDENISPDIEFVNPVLINFSPDEVMVLNCAAHQQLMSPFSTADVSTNSPCPGSTNINFTETIAAPGDCSSGGNGALLQLLWTVTDVCGNLSTLSVTARIEDKIGPVFQDFHANVSIGCRDSLPEIFATDNCGDVIMAINNHYLQSDCAGKYSVVRDITATDPCGNTTSATQTIHVGGAGPVIEGVEKEVCNDLTIPVVTAFDACADNFVDVFLVEDTLDEVCQGMVIQRTWSAVSGCGDSTILIQLIIMGDTTPPEIQMPSYSVLLQFLNQDHNTVYLSQADLIKKLNALDPDAVSVLDDCEPEIIPVFTMVTTMDDCMTTGFMESTTYTWTATDACGNSSSVSIIVDVVDDVPPVIIGIPNDTLIICGPLPDVSGVHAEDNASVIPVIFTQTTLPNDQVGSFLVTRTWTATDVCGNVTTTSQVITWIPDSFLSCNIVLPEIVACNSHGVNITSAVTGGFGVYTYLWEIVGSECFIQGGQGTPELAIYMGWSDVKIILTITDEFGCQSMCMTILHCLEPGEIFLTSNDGISNPDVNGSSPDIKVATLVNADQQVSLKAINVWPNPAKETINLSFKSITNEPVTFRFINFLGQTIMKEKMDVHQGLNTRQIDLDVLPEGSYLLEIKTEKEINTKVVVIMP